MEEEKKEETLRNTVFRYDQVNSYKDVFHYDEANLTICNLGLNPRFVFKPAIPGGKKSYLTIILMDKG